MALVTVQRSPSPSASAETEEQDVFDDGDSNLKSPRQRSFSESYFTVKGAALILPQSDEIAPYTRRVTKSHAGDDIQSHLQAMFSLLRPQDTIKVAVKLEGTHTRYLIVVSCVGRQDTEESVILGIDILEKASVGIILPVWAHMHIQLDGDGGFIVQSDSNMYIFKPVSVQAMWSALQSLNKVVKIAKDKLYIPRGLTHTWVGYYEAKLTTEAVLVSEWNATADLDKSYRTDKLSLVLGDSCGDEDIYKKIRLELKNVMMAVDLEEVNCLFLRKSVEEKMGMELKKYKGFIDMEMMEILGQMDSPTEILEYLYLGSEWNASNLEELQENGVHHILNISREIDNFYPGILHYMNIREWDKDASDLLKYWEDTHRYINKARRRGSKALVHCKMGISRSASTVIAYLMKEKRWHLQQAFEFTKAKRSIINPNAGFWKQLETYEGILTANWNRQLFNRPDSSKPMNPIQDELPEGVNPEDFLAVKLGQELGSSSDPFMHVEQDSRSADSMEDSLPDQLSPDSADRLDKKKFKYSKSDKDNDDSGDDSSTDTDSDLTDSDELSSDYEAEEAEKEKGNKGEVESKVFVPISIPDVQLDIVEERKEIVNVDRRCKSEGDKDVLALTIDENFTSFSREGSASIFKPDASWIKPASESEMENINIIADENEVDGDAKGDEGGGLWMGIKPAEEIEEEKMEVGSVEDTKTDDAVGATIAAQDESVDKDGEVNETVDTNSADPYVRENIPWNPGMVKKQKQDIEEKYGPSNLKQREPLDSNEGETQEVLISDSTQETEKDIETKTAKLETEEGKHSINSVNQSQESRYQIDQSMTVEADRGSECPKISPQMKKSVYEAEEIDLPEGIVRKTLMEIEERNRIILDNPARNLKRSSSLKSIRVTLKAKDRDSGRRKTCIALLSPTHPDYTEREMFATCSDAESPETGIDLGLGEAVCNTASEDSEEEVNSQTGSIKVYKFMGEELSVQEGLVRKQTMDIESKAQEPLIKQQIKSNVGSNSPEHSSDTANNSSTDSKQGTPLLESSTMSVEKSSTDKEIAKRNDNASRLCSDIQREKVDTTDVVQTTENITVRERVGSFGMFTPVKKQTSPESRFDLETLELIREIGSALLNSPGKAELEENEDVDLKDGESLVNHYVKKIERISGVRKKKRGMEIIIIDKSSSLEQHNVASASDSPSVTQNVSTCENRSVTSKWSPVTRKQTYSPPHTSKEKAEQISTQNKSSNPMWSPVSKIEISPQVVEKQSSDFTIVDNNNKTAIMVHDSRASKSELTLNLKSLVAIETDTNNETETELSEKCSVKELLGKFEQPELASGKVTPVFDSSGSSSRTASSPNSSLTSGSDAKGQGHSFSRSKSPLLHRQSEPVIRLSERSMLMSEAKLDEMGTSLSDKSLVKEETAEFQIDNNTLGLCVRPKSASYGPAAGRKVNLRQSQTLSESETEQFTWKGKKVRKLYGKTHPLAKLERKQYRECNSPFYNTM